MRNFFRAAHDWMNDPFFGPAPFWMWPAALWAALEERKNYD